MARRKKRAAGLTPKQLLCSVAALLAALFILTLLNEAIGGVPFLTFDNLQSGIHSVVDGLYETAGVSAQPTQAQGDLLVHYIDVGQADCELIQTPEQNILIDAGDTGGGDVVCDYLRAQDVERIDLLIATHPHADHIGGMADVVERFEIGKVLFSEPPASLVPTSKTYENLLDAIERKGLSITKARPRTVYDLGGGAQLTILGPLEQYAEDLNESSVVCRLDFGEHSFLFTGDASKESEDDLIDTYGSRLKADVLKLGHHGSSTATQPEFLELVDPDFAVCEVGADNSYGHPNSEVLQLLEQTGVTLYRTDENGSIVFASDGTELSVVTEH